MPKNKNELLIDLPTNNITVAINKKSLTMLSIEKYLPPVTDEIVSIKRDALMQLQNDLYKLRFIDKESEFSYFEDNLIRILWEK